jgi:hypothetical protein
MARFKKCHTSKFGKNLIVTFSITQKHEEIIIKIRDFCLTEQSKFKYIRFDPSWEGYEFTLSKKKKFTNLITYLEKFPLKTTKYKNFIIWHKI